MFAVLPVLGSQYKKKSSTTDYCLCDVSVWVARKNEEAKVGMRRLQDFIILTEPPGGICGVSLFCGWQGGS